MSFTKMNYGEYMNIFPVGLTKAQLQKYFEKEEIKSRNYARYSTTKINELGRRNKKRELRTLLPVLSLQCFAL